MQFFHYQKDLKVLECVQRSTGELGKGLECKSDERELGGFCLEIRSEMI